MENLEQTARQKITKALKTIDFLSSRLADSSLPTNKRSFIQEDIEVLEFLIKYAQEALANRGIRV